MKHLIVTDTHLGFKRGSSLYHDITKSLFQDIINVANDRDIKSLIHLGDFFHNRDSIKNLTVIVALEIARMINDSFDDVYIITGNHDTIYKDDVKISLLKMFGKYENIHIINDFYELTSHIAMVPWLFSNDVLNTTEYDVLLGHFDINGCIMNESGTEAKNARFNQSDFKNFKHVISGHYHTPNTYKNIRYLGSPFHTSFNDVAGVRGFYIFDDETYELEFIEFDKYPKFIRIKDVDNPENVAGLVPGNIVELIFTKDHGINKNIEIIERVKSWEPLTLKPKYVNIENSMSEKDITEEDIDIKDHIGILIDYIDQSELPDHINTSMLKKMAEMIYKETVDEN